jgi:hypothetical protein
MRLVGSEEREFWARAAIEALAKIITVFPIGPAITAKPDAPAIVVHPRAVDKGGAADVAATYADALLLEYRARTGGTP